MSRVYLVVVCIFFFTLPLFAQVDTAWVRRYNEVDSADIANAIAVDGSGNVYVTGESKNINGNYDYATVKYYTNGDTAWVRRYYDGLIDVDDKAYDIVVDNSGNVYVTGESCTDIATIKYTSNGDTVSGGWVRRYAGGYMDKANAIAVDGSGNIYVTGRIYYSETDYDYVIIKYTSGGTQSWVRTYDYDNLLDEAHDIAVDGSGNVYVTGRSDDSDTSCDFATLKYNSYGTLQSTRRYTVSSDSKWEEAIAIAVDNSQNVYVTGKALQNGSYWDYVTIKYPAYGREWDQVYDYQNGIDKPFDMTIDDSGNVYVTGVSSNDYLTLKYNTDGDLLWVARYNGLGNSYDEAHAIAVDNSGNVYVTGWSMGGEATADDFATIKYNTNGQEVWIRIHDESYESANDIAVDDSGNVFVTGWNFSDYLTIKYTYSSIQCGDCNGDGNVSVSDVVYLINYLFKGGPSPDPMWKADVNCDHSVSVSDVTYLLNYLTSGGHAPACCG